MIVFVFATACQVVRTKIHTFYLFLHYISIQFKRFRESLSLTLRQVVSRLRFSSLVTREHEMKAMVVDTYVEVFAMLQIFAICKNRFLQPFCTLWQKFAYANFCNYCNLLCKLCKNLLIHIFAIIPFSFQSIPEIFASFKFCCALSETM